MNKTVFTASALMILIPVFLFFMFSRKNTINILSPIGQITEKPLEKYTLERLKTRIPISSNITIGNQVKTGNGFSSYLFYFNTEGPVPSGVEGKKVSGMINVPNKSGEFPVLVLLRGFVDQKIFTTGDGTRHGGEIFAANGFISLAPDFLGYGESASPSANPVEERFQTYTTVLDLFASIKNINNSLKTLAEYNISADIGKIGIWAHSNGGQIALSILGITGKIYPTVLWAPVTKPFPYSILYYTDEFEDHGKKLRKVISDFEKDYDVDMYSYTNYLDRINAPIQLHQGGNDEAVPQKWSDDFVKELKEKKKDVSYFTYPGEDHNFSKGSWSLNIQRNISFYLHNFSTTY